MSIVSLTHCKNYGDSIDSLRKTFNNLGGIEKFINKNDKVLLKPNLCNPSSPQKAALTNPIFMKNLILLIKEQTDNVYIGDLPAVDKKGITHETISSIGLDKVMKETNTKLANLELAPFIAKEIKDYKILERTDFSKVIFDFDVIINVPKLKSHGLTYMTGAVKNLFGLIHMEERRYLHSNFEVDDFCQGIVDIYSYLKPKVSLHIMDAIVAMEGDEGPSYGDSRNVGYVIASDDGVAVDTVAAEITGHQASYIPTIKKADERNLGIGDITKINLIGDDLKKVEFRKHKTYTERYESKNSSSFLEINNMCVKCGNCYRACPVDAIEIKDGMYTINQDKCIKCFCCVENCSYSAIDLKDNDNTVDSRNDEQNKNSYKVATIRLGLDCNQNCIFCTIANDNERKLGLEEVKRLIDKEASENTNEIVFTGGEPTLNKDIFLLFDYVKEKGIKRIDLQTNGVMIDENFLKKIDKYDMSVLLAFHSHEKKIYNEITNSEYYEKAVKALEGLMLSNVILSISHVITTNNYKKLIQFIDFVLSKPYKKKPIFYFSFVRPNGNTRNNLDIVPRLSDVERYVIQAMEHLKKKDIYFHIEGIPLCYMNAELKHSTETIRIVGLEGMKFEQSYIGDGKVQHEKAHEYIKDNLKTKSIVCKNCVFNKICMGVWNEYAEIHGVDELYPFLIDPNDRNRNR